jgi:hypothetical protein
VNGTYELILGRRDESCHLCGVDKASVDFANSRSLDDFAHVVGAYAAASENYDASARTIDHRR